MKLNNNEQELVDLFSETVKSYTETLNYVKQFKLGDFLIAFWPGTQYSKREPIINSYGVHKKYKVVFVDQNDIPWIKEIGRDGKPKGTLLCTAMIKYSGSMQPTFELEVDPDYADSIILQDETYDASLLHKSKSNLHKEITKHNKENRVNTKDSKQLWKFLETIKVGDVLWRSSSSCWTVVSINPITPSIRTSASIRNIATILTIKDDKGNLVDKDFYGLHGKTIYLNKPRSYKELNLI